MKDLKKQENKIAEWFKTKTASAIFALAAFLAGFLFLSRGITGNAIVESENDVLLFSFVPIIGLILMICAFILVFYSLKKK